LEIRGLSRAEAIQVRLLINDPVALEIASIVFATGETKEAVTAWHGTARNDDVEFLVDSIARLSGLSEPEGKDDAEGSLSAKSTGSTTS
jgi:hypothetical protein